tara:strand:+ start:832 stop:2496 length:1665 start_codon:yes stop_codon:yes gene_type:complete
MPITSVPAAVGRFVAVVGPLLLVTSLPGCDSGDPTAESLAFEGGGRVREATRVRVHPIEQRDMVRVTSTTTAIRSEREVEVFPRIAGTVTELKVEEGDRVELGQILCVLDDRQALAALADANVALKEAQNGAPRAELTVRERTAAVARALLTFEQAKRDVDRNEKAGLVSRNDLDKMKLARDQADQDHASAELAVESAEADRDAASTAIDRAQVAVDKAMLDLSFTNVVAPYAGVISARSVEIGDAVSSGKVMFNMVDPDLVRAVIYRPQRELALYRDAVANRATSPIRIEAKPDAIPGTSFEGTIRIVSPTIDSTSGSVKLTIDLDQPSEASGEPRLLPGMLVRLTIVTDKHEGALVVPKRALRREGDRRFLFVVRDGTIARRVEVEEGFADDLDVEVTPSIEGELLAGDLVVVVGNRDLEDGEEVEVQQETPVESVEEQNAEVLTADTEPATDGETRDRLLVQVALDGADPTDVERYLTGPMEAVLAMLAGVEGVTSHSHDGSVEITLTLREGEDPDAVMATVRKSIAHVALPPEASVPTIRRIDADDQEEG